MTREDIFIDQWETVIWEIIMKLCRERERERADI